MDEQSGESKEVPYRKPIAVMGESEMEVFGVRCGRCSHRRL